MPGAESSIWGDALAAKENEAKRTKANEMSAAVAPFFAPSLSLGFFAFRLLGSLFGIAPPPYPGICPVCRGVKGHR